MTLVPRPRPSIQLTRHSGDYAHDHTVSTMSRRKRKRYCKDQLNRVEHPRPRRDPASTHTDPAFRHADPVISDKDLAADLHMKRRGWRMGLRDKVKEWWEGAAGWDGGEWERGMPRRRRGEGDALAEVRGGGRGRRRPVWSEFGEENERGKSEWGGVGCRGAWGGGHAGVDASERYKPESIKNSGQNT
jgi:hypothetical protein